MKIRVLYIGIVLGLNFHSCNKPDIIPPEAEITDIYDITDTSASFKVVVTSESNAQADYGFNLWLDTISLIESSPPLHSEPINTEVAVGEYTVIITDLLSNSHYYVKIYYEGTFDIGGPNDLKNLLIGEEKEFTTLP